MLSPGFLFSCLVSKHLSHWATSLAPLALSAPSYCVPVGAALIRAVLEAVYDKTFERFTLNTVEAPQALSSMYLCPHVLGLLWFLCLI